MVNVKVYFIKTIGHPTKICIECQLTSLITLHIIMLFKTIQFQHFPIHETISDSISVEKNRHQLVKGSVIQFLEGHFVN